MSDSLDWIHVNFSEDAGRKWINDDSGIDPIIASALLDEESRPRILQTAKGVLLILRGVNLNPGSEVEDMISVRLWLERNRVVTSSRRPLKSLDAIKKAADMGKGPGTPAGFALELIDRLSEYVSEVIEDIENHLLAAEEEVNDAGAILKNSPFSQVRRKTARIRRYLAPQRDALERLARQPEPVFDAAHVAQLREQINHVTLVLEDLELVRERALVAQEEFLGILAHEQNTRMLLLSIVAAIFLPLSFLTGLMGMNVAGLPGTEDSLAFGIIVGLMVLTAVVILGLFRLKRWL